MRILKGFKSFVLEVRILKQLRLPVDVHRLDGQGKASRASWCKAEGLRVKRTEPRLRGESIWNNSMDYTTFQEKYKVLKGNELKFRVGGGGR